MITIVLLPDFVVRLAKYHQLCWDFVTFPYPVIVLAVVHICVPAAVTEFSGSDFHALSTFMMEQNASLSHPVLLLLLLLLEKLKYDDHLLPFLVTVLLRQDEHCNTHPWLPLPLAWPLMCRNTLVA